MRNSKSSQIGTVETLVMLVGALLVFAANSKLQGGVPGSLPLVPLAMTAALWYSLTFTEYLFGIPLVLGLANRNLQVLAALLFGLFSTYQIVNILNGESECICFSYPVSSVVILALDLCAMGILVLSSLRRNSPESSGEFGGFRKCIATAFISLSLLAFLIPFPQGAMFPGSREQVDTSKQKIDLEDYVKPGRELDFCNLLSTKVDFQEMKTEAVLIGRTNCGACMDLIDNWEASHPSMTETTLLVLVDSPLPSSEKSFPAWRGRFAAFRKNYEVMAKTPTLLFVRNGSFFSSPLNN